MAQIKQLIRQGQRKNFLIKFAFKRLKAKFYKKNSIKIIDPLRNLNIFKNIPRDSSKTRVNNHCFSTGRFRAVSRFYGLCRHEIRRFSNYCVLPGLKNSSW